MQRNDVEVILADNGSTDQSISVSRSLFPGINILRLGRNYGFAEANNRAAAISRGDYLVFLNNDTIVDKNWLRELLAVADSDSSIAVCGSRIMFIDCRHKINHAGGKITMIGSGYDRCFGMTKPPSNLAHHTGYASGASMLIRAAVFRKLRGFDPAYFAFCEDVDLAWRAWLAGYKVIHVPTSIVYHKFSGTWHQENDKIYYWHRNCKINTLKNFGAIYAIRGLLLNFLFDILRVLEQLRTNPRQVVALIASGYFWIFRNLRHIMSSRAFVSRLRCRDDKYLYKTGIFASMRESLLEYRRARKDYMFMKRSQA
jgi:hypothetical protein